MIPSLQAPRSVARISVSFIQRHPFHPASLLGLSDRRVQISATLLIQAAPLPSHPAVLHRDLKLALGFREPQSFPSLPQGDPSTCKRIRPRIIRSPQTGQTILDFKCPPTPSNASATERP